MLKKCQTYGALMGDLGTVEGILTEVSSAILADADSFLLIRFALVTFQKRERKSVFNTYCAHFSHCVSTTILEKATSMATIVDYFPES